MVQHFRLACQALFFVGVKWFLSGLSYHGVYPKGHSPCVRPANRLPDGKAAYQGLKDQGILIRYFDRPGLTDKIRITVGTADENNALLAGIKSLLLPAIALSVVQAAILARVTRSAVLEVLREDFVRTARAKGLGKREVLWSHVLRNAMIPVMTVMGLQFANLLAGTIVIENVFYLPGLGRLIFQSIANRDLIVVRNCVMLLATMVVIVNFVVDVLYAFVDPRIKVHDL